MKRANGLYLPPIEKSKRSNSIASADGLDLYLASIQRQFRRYKFNIYLLNEKANIIQRFWLSRGLISRKVKSDLSASRRPSVKFDS